MPCVLLLSALTARAVTIDCVEVGDPKNACDPQEGDCHGSAARICEISEFEVTNAQYAQVSWLLIGTWFSRKGSRKMKKIRGFIVIVGVLSFFVTSFIFTDAKAQKASRDRGGLPALVTKLEADVAEQKTLLEQTDVEMHALKLEMLFLKLNVNDPNLSEMYWKLLDAIGRLRQLEMEAEIAQEERRNSQLEAEAQAGKRWQTIGIIMKFFSNLPDEDGDGTPDLFDLCPEEAGSAENFGCVAPQRDAYSDLDGDGFPTYMDLCPEVKGTYYGCTKDVATEDSDGDEIPDFLDGCPDLAGPWENAGCPEIVE